MIEPLALNIQDLRSLAKRRLPRGIFEFIERGAEDDLAIRNNREAFGKFAIRPRVLRDVSSRSLSTALFDKPLPAPLVLAPTGAAGLVWHDGELALARAAANAQLPFTLSTASLTSIERIAEEAPGRLWFQLYMWPDREMSHELVRRVARSGFEALVVTVDTAVSPNREFNTRNGFGLPFRVGPRNAVDIALHPRWLLSVIAHYVLTTGMPRLENYPEELQRSLTGMPKGKSTLPKNDSLTWEDFDSLRRIWEGPLIVKGVLHPDDAAEAQRRGADAVIVSNHGGRNLDSSLAPLLALPEICDRVAGRIPVMMDGGIERGSDVVKALSLGAAAVLVGRAPLWGVAAAGESGVTRALGILADETLRVLGQCGCASIDELGPHLLWTEAGRWASPSNSKPPSKGRASTRETESIH